MISNKNILIKNIYYMLSYAFKVLKQQNYEEVEAEEFDGIEDLFASILSKGMGQLLKQGLHKEYIFREEGLTTLRGKLEFSNSIKNKIQHKKLLHCEYDELSENNLYNQIIKTTAMILLREKSVKTEQKMHLKKVLQSFIGIDEINLKQVMWDRIVYQRNNQNYIMLINICYLVTEGMILSTLKGKYKLSSFIDEQRMFDLYERFVREYYVRKYQKDKKFKVEASHIKWDTKDGVAELLPSMKTDITITNGEKTLIIDTKYYSKILQKNFDKESFHSNNLYQIFAYVKNKDTDNSGDVAGLLLYAKTEDEVVEDQEYKIGGNSFYIKTLDLNQDFSSIKEKLDRISDVYFSKLLLLGNKRCNVE